MSLKSPVEGDPHFPIWKLGYDQGYKDGQVEMRGRIVDLVSDAYLDPNKGPERGTPEAEVYLGLLRRIGKELDFKVGNE